MDWQQDAQQDQQDAEFETFLRQFQLRTPPAFKAGRRVTPAKLAMAAVIVLACAIPLQLLRDKPAAPNSPDKIGDVGLSPKPADAPAAAPANTPANIASPSNPGTASPSVIAIIPRRGPVAQNGPLRAGTAIRPPTRIFSVNAIYPEEARAAGIEGAVVMRATIGEDGSVTNVVVLRSVPMLDEAAIESVLQWQYEPTLLNGVPVEVEMNVTVNFTLQ